MKKINTPHLLNFLNDGLIEAGCDEAGRGPLAGVRGSRHIAYGFLPSAAERLEKDDGGAS